MLYIIILLILSLSQLGVCHTTFSFCNIMPYCLNMLLITTTNIGCFISFILKVNTLIYELCMIIIALSFLCVFLLFVDWFLDWKPLCYGMWRMARKHNTRCLLLWVCICKTYYRSVVVFTLRLLSIRHQICTITERVLERLMCIQLKETGK